MSVTRDVRLWTVRSGECLFKIAPSSSASLTHMDVSFDMSTIIVADASAVVYDRPHRTLHRVIKGRRSDIVDAALLLMLLLCSSLACLIQILLTGTCVTLVLSHVLSLEWEVSHGMAYSADVPLYAQQ